MTVPVLSKEQRLQALELAKQARSERARIKERVQSGELSLADVVAMRNDEVVGKMRVADLIASVPHFGEAKTTKIMQELRISQSRRLQGLGKRQVADLLERLG